MSNSHDEHGQGELGPQDAEAVADVETADAEPQVDEAAKELAELEKKHRGGASWFYWVAGLSVINSILLLTGQTWGFIFGLGITMVIDEIAIELAKELGNAVKIVAIVLDVIVAGVLVLFGVFATKRHLWAYIVGLVLYVIDGLIFLAAADIMGIIFHAIVLVLVIMGMRACYRLNQIDALARQRGY